MAKSPAGKIGTAHGSNYAVRIDGIDNEFFKQSIGRRMGEFGKVRKFLETASTAAIYAKGKPTLAAVRQWIQKNKPSQYYANWQADSSYYKDDVVYIAYIPKELDV